jgi:hypothetical protein
VRLADGSSGWTRDVSASGMFVDFDGASDASVCRAAFTSASRSNCWISRASSEEIAASKRPGCSFTSSLTASFHSCSIRSASSVRRSARLESSGYPPVCSWRTHERSSRCCIKWRLHRAPAKPPYDSRLALLQVESSNRDRRTADGGVHRISADTR